MLHLRADHGRIVGEHHLVRAVVAVVVAYNNRKDCSRIEVALADTAGVVGRPMVRVGGLHRHDQRKQVVQTLPVVVRDAAAVLFLLVAVLLLYLLHDKGVAVVDVT